MDEDNSSEPTLIESFRLVPVIEIEPFPYMSEDRKHPDGSTNPDGWAAFWRDSLADSGIHNLDAIRAASWHVATSSFNELNQAALDKVLGTFWRHRNDNPENFSIEDCSPLAGGFAMLDDSNKPILEPTCCGDLGNFTEWTQVTSNPPQEWAMLWIGHPWVHVRASGETIVFSELHESNSPEKAAFRIPIGRLQHALREAHSELTRFASLVGVALANYGHTRQQDTFAHFLCGLVSRTPSP